MRLDYHVISRTILSKSRTTHVDVHTSKYIHKYIYTKMTEYKGDRKKRNRIAKKK